MSLQNKFESKGNVSNSIDNASDNGDDNDNCDYVMRFLFLRYNSKNWLLYSHKFFVDIDAVFYHVVSAVKNFNTSTAFTIVRNCTTRLYNQELTNPMQPHLRN
jgi:hypothetical protein